MSNTPRPKSIALAFLLGAFLAGGAVGFAADRAFAPEPHHRYDETAMRDSMAKELKLSDAQRRQMDTILDWGRARRNDIMKPIQPSLRAARDSGRVLIMQLLDSAQQTRFRNVLDRSRADSTRRPKPERN